LCTCQWNEWKNLLVSLPSSISYFDVYFSFLLSEIYILVYRNLLDLASGWHKISSIYSMGHTSGPWFMVHKIFLLQMTSATHIWSLVSLLHSVRESACRNHSRNSAKGKPRSS
jgi:hypothetical protein